MLESNSELLQIHLVILPKDGRCLCAVQFGIACWRERRGKLGIQETAKEEPENKGMHPSAVSIKLLVLRGGSGGVKSSC